MSCLSSERNSCRPRPEFRNPQRMKCREEEEEEEEEGLIVAFTCNH
jgi:hypothetical protein